MIVEPMLERLDAYDAYRWAVDLFEDRDYYAAAKVLRHLVDTHPEESQLRAARELLVRSYFHSAQTERAAAEARVLLDLDPTNEYAALLLARALQRAGRRDAAESASRMASALGASA